MRAQQRMKHQANKNRSEREFNVGELVYLKLQPHIQLLVAFRGNHKLFFRYLGPFKILAKVGSMAYKLDLLPSATIHPVDHVSQLKKHVLPNREVLDSLHLVATDLSVKIQPVHVLSSRAI